MKPAAKITWDPDLYARFRRARPKSMLRRLLESQLVRVNEGLIVTLCAQLLGRDDQGRRVGGFAHKAGRVYDADRLEWDDAMQLARIGFARAIQTFDPKRGGIAGYARWWIKDQFQRVTCISAPITTPQRKDDQRPGCEVVSPLPLEVEGADGDRRWLGDVLGYDEGGVLAFDGFTPQMLAEWQESGVWPDSLEEVVAREKAKVIVQVPAVFVRDALAAFLGERLRFAPGATAASFDVWNAYRVTCRRLGQAEKPRREFNGALFARGVRRTTKRTADTAAAEAYRGVRLALQ